MTQLSQHFSLKELTRSYEGIRHGIDNTPDKKILANLEILADKLEELRTLFGTKIVVLSGYRCEKLNTLIGGSKKSAHMQGLAADIICPGWHTPEQMQALLRKSGIKVDQCIEEGTWLHVSFASPLRNEYLKATFSNGKVSYKKV